MRSDALRRYGALRSMRDFARAISWGKPTYQPAWYTDVICDHLDPRVSRAVAAAAGAPAPAVGTSWAAQLTQEEIDRLPPHVLERLRAIADEQRRLDDEARERVARALEPVIETTARDPRALPEGKGP